MKDKRLVLSVDKQYGTPYSTASCCLQVILLVREWPFESVWKMLRRQKLVYKAFDLYYYDSKDFCVFFFVFFLPTTSLWKWFIVHCSIGFICQGGGSRDGVCDRRQSQRGGKRCSRSLQPLGKPMVRQALQPMVKQFGADFHLQPMENPTAEQMNMSSRKLWHTEKCPFRNRFSGRSCA